MNTHNHIPIAIEPDNTEVEISILDIPEPLDERLEELAVTAREQLIRRGADERERGCRKDRYSRREDRARSNSKNKPRYDRTQRSYGYIAE